nr:RHS repeat-associated core domain-containing protein [Chlamydiota bacterium]
LSDLDGNLIEEYAYTAFGEELTTGNLSPWRFASKRQEGDLVYFGKRYYSPDQGRWLTPDPLGFADGLNLYATRPSPA